jgi:hypothetical protein
MLRSYEYVNLADIIASDSLDASAIRTIPDYRFAP